MKDDLKNTTEVESLRERFDTSSKPTVAVDVEKYQAYLDGTDMTDVEKEEFLQELWQIIIGFVELGFGVHPVQEVCGKPGSADNEPTASNKDGLCSDKPNKDNDTNRLRP